MNFTMNNVKDFDLEKEFPGEKHLKYNEKKQIVAASGKIDSMKVDLHNQRFIFEYHENGTMAVIKNITNMLVVVHRYDHQGREIYYDNGFGHITTYTHLVDGRVMAVLETPEELEVVLLTETLINYHPSWGKKNDHGETYWLDEVVYREDVHLHGNNTNGVVTNGVDTIFIEDDPDWVIGNY